MNHNFPNTTLFLEAAGKWSISRIRENRVPLSAAFITGLLCYLYPMTNKLVNHDDAYSLFSKGATVSSGRWGLGALDTILPNYSMPWINGLLALILMAVAAALLVRLLNVRSGILQGLLAGSILAFPSLICAYAYLFTTHAFALSFLLAVLSVWILTRQHKLAWLPAIGCMIASLSIYQSYISIAAGALLLILIRQLMEGENLPSVLRKGVGYVLFLAASLGLYYLATQAVLILKDVSFNEYAGGNMGFSFSNLPAAALLAYQNFLRFFREGLWGLMPTAFSRLLHSLSLILSLVLIVLHMAGSFPRDWGRALLLAILMALLPLAANCMYLFTAADAVHTLVLYGFICLYGLLAITVDISLPSAGTCKISRLSHRIGAELISLAMAAMLLCNVFVANEVWLNLHLRYENAYSFFTSLSSDIKSMPEFGPDSKLALIGTYQGPEFYDQQFAFTSGMSGLKGILPDSYSNGEFLTYYVGFPIPLAGSEEIHTLCQLEAVTQMPAYPYYGSILAMEDYIIVKLS